MIGENAEPSGERRSCPVASTTSLFWVPYRTLNSERAGVAFKSTARLNPVGVHGTGVLEYIPKATSVLPTLAAPKSSDPVMKSYPLLARTHVLPESANGAP